MTVKLNSGKLRHWVTFQVPSDGVDSLGEPLPFVDGTSHFASVIFVSGFNNFQAGTFSGQATHKITMRYVPNVNTGWQVRFGSRIFQILYPDDVEGRGIQLDLFCAEIS